MEDGEIYSYLPVGRLMRSSYTNGCKKMVLALAACIPLFLACKTISAANSSELRSKVADKPVAIIYRYVINLESTFSEDTQPWLPQLKSLKQYTFYTSRYKHKKKTWYRLRIGFFASHNSANRVVEILKPYYPGIWVDRIRSDEFLRMKNWEANKGKKISKTVKSIRQEKQAPAKKMIVKVGVPAHSNSHLMELARRALAEKKYRDAAQYYMQVLSAKDGKYQQKAQELLGVSREKNGQLAHAKAEYELYLKKYPKGEGAERVKQRLLALMTARFDPKRRMVEKPKGNAYWSSFGSIAQFLRRNAFNTGGISTQNQTLQSDVVISARRRGERYDLKTFISADHFYDADNPKVNYNAKLSSLYAELVEKQGAYSGKIGRFTRNSDGVMGRMDGVLGNVSLNKKWKLNAIIGHPVDSSTSNTGANKPFYSIGLYAGTFKQSWDLNFYYFSRKVESMVDRQALGGEIRYLGAKQTAFALLDYDTYFNKLNTLFLVSNWRLPRNSLINLTVNYRMSPLLMTTSALQGQGTTSIDSLKKTYSDKEIKQLALDRTAVYKSLTISGARALTDKYSINGDVTISNLSGTPASGGVDATPPTGNEFFYGIQFIGLNLYSKTDTSVGEIGYEDTSNYLKYKLAASTRWRDENKWSYRPKLAYEIRDNVNGSKATKISPSLRVDYRYSKKTKFEFEILYEDIAVKSPAQGNESNYSISVGYIYDFF